MRALVVSLLFASTLLSPACFTPEKPACAFSCGPGGMCPEDYTCMSDGYCHRDGTNTQCEYPDAGGMDAAIPDLTPGPDLAGTD